MVFFKLILGRKTHVPETWMWKWKAVRLFDLHVASDESTRVGSYHGKHLYPLTRLTSPMVFL